MSAKTRKKSVEARQSWTQDQVLRQFELPPKQLANWQEQGLIQEKAEYFFEDLLAIQVLLRLRSMGVSPKKLKAAFEKIRERMDHVENPLTELKVFVEGKKIQVQAAGTKMEAVSGQFVLDFDPAEIRRMLTFPGNRKAEEDQLRRAKLEAENWFQQGLDLEQNGASKREALSAYQKALELNPGLAGALVNIGTIHFNARNWRESERYYQRAIEVDGDYPLAHFNLANLHEELGRTSLAIQHYKKALDLQPGYADAHYNLALLYQTRGRSMEAMRHWKLYLKLDPASHWAAIAKREMTKLKQEAIVLAPPLPKSS